MIEQETDRLERTLLFRILVFTIIATLGYLVLDLVVEYHEHSVESAIISIIVFGLLAFATKQNFHFNLIKHVVMVVLCVAIMGGFFTFEGIKGVFLLDYINLIFFGFVMFRGTSRLVFGALLVIILIYAVYIHFYHQEMIRYIYKGPNEAIYLMYGIFSRSINSVFIAISVKLAYEIERKHVIVQNKELQARIGELNDLYQRLESQSIEVQEQNEYINELNLKLEYRVNERTDKIKEQNKKLIEYAFFNAHKVRGPLARILGIIQLKKIKPDISKEELLEYFLLLELSADELDNVVRSINSVLETDEAED